MLIKVFDSEWFDTTGIRLQEFDGQEYSGTKIIFGQYAMKNPDYENRRTPTCEYKIQDNCIIIFDKTSDEVALEINKQLGAKV